MVMNTHCRGVWYEHWIDGAGGYFVSKKHRGKVIQLLSEKY